jgi:4-amino-4-deoxychorismate lyase
MSDAPLHLIETLRFEPGSGFRNLDLHRKRMARSAAALGLSFSATAFDAALAQVPEGQGPRRVRLELAPGGEIALVHAPYAPLSDGTVWRVALASTALSSSDPLLRHKTTRRRLYDAARAEYPAGAVDEVLLLNERAEVCEGTITSVFLPSRGDRFVTPALSCGLLAGVLRETLLAEGKAQEGVFGPADLEGRDFFVGNSLRGLIPARLVSA